MEVTITDYTEQEGVAVICARVPTVLTLPAVVQPDGTWEPYSGSPEDAPAGFVATHPIAAQRHYQVPVPLALRFERDGAGAVIGRISEDAWRQVCLNHVQQAIERDPPAGGTQAAPANPFAGRGTIQL